MAVARFAIDAEIELIVCITEGIPVRDMMALKDRMAKANSKTLIKDLKIVYPTPWQKLHFRGIESAYKNSPYYEYYIDDLMPFFEKQETYLFDHNLAILTTILDFLKLKRDIRLLKENPNTVKSILYRSLKKLKIKMSREEIA